MKLIKQYLFAVLILGITLLFFAVVPGLISGISFYFYIGIVLTIAYPIAMYYMIKHFIKLLNIKTN